MDDDGMNPWERKAFQYHNGQQQARGHDSLIYPGLYSYSDYDVMTMLAHVYARPNPQVNMGPVDANCAIIICNLSLDDHPIVYASPAFLSMTQYSQDEVLGKNCRFLQAPGGNVKPKSARKHVDKETVRRIRKAVDKNTELEIEVTNFKKNGKRFQNYLTIIPLKIGSPTYNYSVGFQCELDK